MYMHGVGSISDDVAALKAKAVDFVSAQNLLLATEPPKTSALYPKWLELKNYGDNVRVAIGKITSMIDTASSVASSIGYGITHPFGYDLFGNDTNQVNGMGVLPLIPLIGTAVTATAISGAIAAMAYFITSAYEFKKMAEADPATRAALLQRQKIAAGTGVSGALSSIKGILFVGAVIYFLPKLMDAHVKSGANKHGKN